MTFDATNNGTATIIGNINLNSSATTGVTRTFTINNGTAATDTTIAGAITNTTSAGLTKAGTGTLTLSGANTYSGATTINAGTLSLDNAGSTTARLANTSNITVNSGGTLLLASSSGASTDRIRDAATMTLNGGTLNTGGLSEHGASNNTAGIGALTLQSTPIIDMGSATSIVAFANSSSASWSGTLNIYNWSGNPGPAGGNGTDQLFIGSDNTGLTATQLTEVQFFTGSGTGSYGIGALILANGEIVPIPEPGTWAAGGLALGGLLCWQRRRFARFFKRGP
jgi:autotransporter-associated beta strand protein